MPSPTHRVGEAAAGVASILLSLLLKGNPDAKLVFEYTNWRGEKRTRKVAPFRVWYGATEWHPVPQLLLEGYCHDAMAKRDFAIADINISTLQVTD